MSKQNNKMDGITNFTQEYTQDDFLNQSSDMVNLNMKKGSVDLHYNYESTLNNTSITVA